MVDVGSEPTYVEKMRVPHTWGGGGGGGGGGQGAGPLLKKPQKYWVS